MMYSFKGDNGKMSSAFSTRVMYVKVLTRKEETKNNEKVFFFRTLVHSPIRATNRSSDSSFSGTDSINFSNSS